jgi:hypothetical protein
MRVEDLTPQSRFIRTLLRKNTYMEKYKIGMRVSDQGFEFFGTDEVNALLSKGKRVYRIDPGEVLIDDKSKSEYEEVESFALAGFEIVVTLFSP